MRDVVRGARLPIVVGRVYDSRIRDGSDFGPGWKLSVAESLKRVGNEMIYTDASNSTYVLRLDGPRLRSDYPHLTGIIGGSLAGNWAVIQTGGLTKTFRRYSDSLRLIAVRDRSGNWLRFNYSGASVSRVVSSSGRYVQLKRDRSGKIVAAQDDTGRTVSYRYDAAGGLIESVGISGGATRFRYDDKGYLSAVIDPRGFESIAVQFRADGRAALVDSQHERTVYEFGTNSTTVRNARQRASVLGFHESGLVESATDFAGGVSNLEFDLNLRVVRLLFNGATVASAEYADGRVVSLSRLDWNDMSTRQQSFGYDSSSRLASVSLGDRIIAAYGYDASGRVIQAVDVGFEHFGSEDSQDLDETESVGPNRIQVERHYRYDSVGNLSALSMGDASLGFSANRLGMVERVTWAANNTIGITYDETDRIDSLRFDLGADSVGVEYRYDDAGFRVSGRYDILQSIGHPELALGYDSAGNIIHIELPGPDGATRTTRHTIGSENELLSVTPMGGEAFEQVFEYDESGRAVRAAQGNGREAAFRYDELGRLTDVYLDGEHVLTGDHDPMDLDPVHSTDARTAFTAIGDPVASAVFGSLDEIVYTRPFGTPYGIVRFAPEMARFVVPDRVVVPPDSLILASLRRRNLAVETTLDPSPMQGFDKLSSSLFLPPEYFASNCAFCVGGVTGFEIERVGSGPVTTGQTITFEADGSWEYCELHLGYSGSKFIIPLGFTHDVDFVGGSGGATYNTSSANKQFSGSFSSPGTKTVRDTLSCSCGGIFLAHAATTVDIIGPVPTSASVTTPAGRIGYIDRNLNMPTVQFSASVSPSSIPVADTTFHWYLVMAYTQHGKNFVHRVPGSGTVNITGSNTWQPSWGSLLAGGNEITVYVSATANGGTSPTSGKSGFQIHGQNPTQAQLFARATFVEARAVMWQESTHRQFASTRYTGIALPLRGPPDGWGLMQRDPLQSEAQLWNWQTSLGIGVAYLNGRRTEAQNYLNTWYDEAARTPGTEDDWPWNPRQSPDKVWDGAFGRYNAGVSIYAPNGNQGVVNCSHYTTKSPKACNYANAVRGHINTRPW